MSKIISSSEPHVFEIVSFYSHLGEQQAESERADSLYDGYCMKVVSLFC